MIITRSTARKLSQSADAALNGVSGAVKAFLDAQAEETETIMAEASHRRDVFEYAVGQGLGILTRFLDEFRQHRTEDEDDPWEDVARERCGGSSGKCGPRK